MSWYQSQVLLAQLDVEGFDGLLMQWIAALAGVADGIYTLVCDGKTLLGCVDETAYSALRSSASARRVTAEAS